METLSTVQQRLAKAGFVDDLAATPTGLHAASLGQDLDPSELVAVEMVRFEGSSDPDDEALLVAVADDAGRPLGTFTVPYGPLMSTHEATALRSLRTVTSGDETVAPHDGHHHIAAVFADRARAEAAVAELREHGLGSTHLGIAVHGAGDIMFENDEVVDLSHAVGIDAAAGAGLGFLGGMLLLSLVVPGIGAIGVGGILALGGASAFGGAMVGGYLGIAEASAELDEHEQLRHTPLADGEILVVACAHDQPDVVKAAFAHHGGRISQA